MSALGWQLCEVASLAYCSLCGCRIERGARVWRYFAAPHKSTHCACEACADAV